LDTLSEELELDTLCEEVRKAKFAEANQRDRAREIEEELARVRIASAQKVNEEEVAPGFAGPNGLEGRNLQRLGRESDEVDATDPASPA
jgi:hypothetical protein